MCLGPILGEVGIFTNNVCKAARRVGAQRAVVQLLIMQGVGNHSVLAVSPEVP